MSPETKAPAKFLPARYEPKAERPLWQMDLRHKLGLEPGQNDPISVLLVGAIYASQSQEEFEERVKRAIEGLNSVLTAMRHS